VRVLQVHTRYRERGGEDSVVSSERAMLIAAGHTVESHEFENPSSAKAAAGALLKSAWNRQAAAQVVETARRFGADVVHVHKTWIALSPVVFRSLAAAGFPTVATMHNYRLHCDNSLLYSDGRPCEECVGHLPWRGVMHRCYRGSAIQSGAVVVTITTHRAAGTWREVDVVVALTEFAAHRLVLAGVPQDRVIVKPNTVEDPGRRLRPASDSDVVLYVGRLTEPKGILDLVEAWRRISAKNLRLVVMGDGPLLSTLRETAATGIELRGAVEPIEVANAMKEARALVVPSRWFEGLPMVMIEGLAAGLPVIVPDHGAFPGLLGDAGWSFNAGDTRSLGERLDQLGDPAAVSERGGAARRRYEELFSPRVGLPALEEAYRLARHRAGR
jgi:glycosyltransferase involved in cell wall biosynthesis